MLELTGDCWVEITDARNERLAYGLYHAGTTQTLQGQAPFQVFLGNAPAAHVSYGGKSVAGFHVSSNGVARFSVGGTAGSDAGQ